MSYRVGRASLRVRLTMCVVYYAARVSISIMHDTHSQAHSYTYQRFSFLPTYLYVYQKYERAISGILRTNKFLRFIVFIMLTRLMI